MEVDWDLYAVVRSCGQPVAISSSAPDLASCSNWVSPETSTATFEHSTKTVQLGSDDSLEFQFYEPRNEELHDLCQPFFFPKSEVVLPMASSSPPLPSPVSCSTFLTTPLPSHLVEVKRPKISKRDISALAVRNKTKPQNLAPRSKRRKLNPFKKICQVPAEGVSADTWSWRKYGQKPIKGSPYPRGYYRCSSSKGCSARKQVERNRSDPNMFIVTYASEHNHPAPTHRNSLAGTTRHHNKPLLVASSSSETVLQKQQSVSSSSGATTASDEDADADRDMQQSTTAEDEEDFDELIMRLREEDHHKDVMDIGLLDIALGDDFFDGLDEIARDDVDGSSPCPRSAFPLPWLVNANNTAAASAACST